MTKFLKSDLKVQDAKGFPGGTTHGSMNPASTAKGGGGPGVNSSLVGDTDNNRKFVAEAGKSGSGGTNDWKSISAKADTRELICDAGK